MTIKQKFERIDQSKLEPNQVNALKIVVDFTENFKTTDKEKIKITNDKLDTIIGKLQEKNPDALKPAPTAKKAGTAKKTSSTKTPKRNVFSVAKEIKKAGETFEEAKARASKQIKEEKEQANKIVKTEMQKLQQYIKQHKELQGISGTDLGRDASRVAKVGGRRISKNGNIYYENRENRKDRLAPNYPKNAPLLENGGDFQSGVYADGGKVSEDLFENYEKQPKKLSEIVDFYMEKFEEGDYDYQDSQNFLKEVEAIGYTFDYGLDNEPYGLRPIGTKLKEYANGGVLPNEYVRVVKYADGNYRVEKKTISNDFAHTFNDVFEDLSKAENFAKKIAVNNKIKYIGISTAPYDFVKGKKMANGGELKDFEQKVKDALKLENKWHYISENLGGKQVDLKMFVGKKEVDVQIFKINGMYARMPKNYVGKRETLKMIMDNFEGNYELGGEFMTDPTFGNFQNQVYAKGGLLTPKERYILEIKGLSGVRATAIEDYIEDNGLSNDEVLNIVIGLGRKQLNGSDVSTAIVGKKGNSASKKLIAFAKGNQALKMALGGVMVSDLAGHTGGSGTNTPTLLSGYSGTYYTGLVGETGAMSSGEMFESGGTLSDPAILNAYSGTRYTALVEETGALSSGESFEMGGVMVSDLSGHTGCSGTNTPTLLSGYSGTHYTGLVGETGALSSGELFADGGGIRMPDLERRKKVVNSLTKEDLIHYLSQNWGYRGFDRKAITADPNKRDINNLRIEVLRQMEYEDKNGVYEMGGGLPNGAQQNYVNYYLGATGILAEGGSLQAHGIEEGDTFIKTISGNIQKVKDKDGNIVFINLSTGERDSEPPLPFKKGGSVDHKYLNHSQDYEVRYAKGKNRHGYGNVKYLGGGVVDGTLNKKVYDLASKSGFLISDWATSEYNLILAQALVESLTDANFHSEAKEVVAKLEKKPWSNELFKSKYFNPDNDVREFAIKVSQNCAYDGDDIVNAYYYLAKMQGSSVGNLIDDLFLSKSKTKKAVSKKYIDHDDIVLINIKKGSKQLTYKAVDVLNGANILEKGGQLENIANYIPIRDVISVDLKDGTQVKPSNGYWIKKDAKPYIVGKLGTFDEGGNLDKVKWQDVEKGDSARVKDDNKMGLVIKNYGRKFHLKFPNGTEKTFDASDLEFFKLEKDEYEMNDYGNFKKGGKVEEAIINKDGIRVRSVAQPKKKLTEAEWLAKHSESKEARSYKAGGDLSKYSEFIQDEFPESKKLANKFAKKYNLPFLVLVEKDNYDEIYIKEANGFYAFPKSYIDAHDVLYVTADKMAEGGVTFDEKSSSIAKKFVGKAVEPKYQKEYGKVYSKEEANEVGDKIAGSMVAKEKMAKGGVTSRGGIMLLAKQIRKENESWKDALKRAGEQLRK